MAADNIASDGGSPDDPSQEARVVVLEQIAKDTREARFEMRAEMRADQRADFRTLLAMIADIGGLTLTVGLGLRGVMGKGFHRLN
jgi:hypothetical protein